MSKVTVIGMDLGDKNHKAVALAEAELAEQREVPCTPEGVATYLKRHPGALLVIETGTHCRWVCSIGMALGHEVLVGNARKLRMIWSSNQKNDWRDAETLARVGRADRKLLSPVKLRGEDDQKLLRMVKARDMLVRQRTAIVNAIRGFTKAEGCRLPTCSTETFKTMQFEVPPSLRKATKPLFRLLHELAKQIAIYDRMLSETLKADRASDAKLLETVAGVGPVTTAAYLATVGDPVAFGEARDAGPYFGLSPKQKQSGEIDKQLRITKAGNALTRRLLVSSAHYILGPFGADSDLRRHGLRIAERGGKNARKRAVVAVARKLAVVMMAMLKNRTEYRPLNQVESAA